MFKDILFISILNLFGLTIGNFIFQFAQKIPNYEVAFERSFFQGIAIFALACSLSQALPSSSKEQIR